MKSDPPHAALTPNNFDLIRLVAAAQVMLAHSIHYLSLGNVPFIQIINYLPGVPIFFFISGFLISASWERSTNYHDFFQKRALRIFPALWAVWAFTLAILIIFFDRHVLALHWGRVVLWSLMQITIFQDWYPSFFNTFGTGLLNGSLWTIPVEIGFYAATPFLYFVMTATRKPLSTLICVTVLSFAMQMWLTYPVLTGGDEPRWMTWLTLSPFPWIGMFTCGVLAQRYRSVILPYLAGRFFLVLAIYGVATALTVFLPVYPVLRSDGNAMGIVNFVILAGLVLSASYTNPKLSDKLLRRNDISYGIYLVHLPILNLVIQLGISGFEAFLWSWQVHFA